MEPTTLAQMLLHPDSAEPAVIAEASGLTISHRALSDQIDLLAETLLGAGLRPGDAVALVLPNGLELIVLVLALARARLIAAPINPASKADELRGMFADVEPRAIITVAANGIVASAAAGLAAPIWAVSVEPSGAVSLIGLPPISRTDLGVPDPQDVALYLHTSGTEGRPKVVPLTHNNVLRAALHIASHYALTPNDRSLVVMPLFHGHGLIGAALPMLASGGAIIVPPRFSASGFWGSFHRHRATWYTAVPTIHQILLERADADGAPHSGPRFIRSCSAALAPAVLDATERRFGAPVVEAYGITEASHQVASNPLPPGARKPGTVGFGVGAEIAVIDSVGRHLPGHSSGEVVVRGSGVMNGYHHNPSANATVFVDGWLRTGDAGTLDDDGYLTITGRLKEMINRGGEKISPTEIEDVLLTHPAVAEAAAFGVPDSKYGEVVEAAVVLRADADPEALRAFCLEHLADFKVPRVIRVVTRLPKNAMGKLQRSALVGSPALHTS